MKTFQIEWLDDDFECECCGVSYAEGAKVQLDGKPFLELVPKAHCFGGSNYPSDYVYQAILEKLGYIVSEEF